MFNVSELPVIVVSASNELKLLPVLTCNTYFTALADAPHQNETLLVLKPAACAGLYKGNVCGKAALNGITTRVFKAVSLHCKLVVTIC